MKAHVVKPGITYFVNFCKSTQDQGCGWRSFQVVKTLHSTRAPVLRGILFAFHVCRSIPEVTHILDKGKPGVCFVVPRRDSCIPRTLTIELISPLNFVGVFVGSELVFAIYRSPVFLNG
jgi:hypothetical protein